ncbi:dihydroorotase [Rhizomonospora bruguierae]|uniref:dihydroorotase n=1 Tax=Rhizomonospora bruguierae TaxID=1581705 RepID=UPI001BCDBBAC|nr:amidohydrolase family protein [Micromonospora sp. NBRC 107566]
MPRFDTVIRDGLVLVESQDDPITASIGISSGVVTAIGHDLDPVDAAEVINAEGRLVLPGAVDGHFHLGIYRSIEEDTQTETVTAAVGGTTSIISYFRTGSHYLERSGPYREIFPEVLAATRGRAHVDFGYHLAPMTDTHVTEMDWLVCEMGVSSFKFFWSYIGARMDSESESYDAAFAYRIMEKVATLDERLGDAGRVSLSVHCEDADLISLFQQRADGIGLAPLGRYAAARPALGEAISILRTGQMAAATGAPVNLLHLSSEAAVTAVGQARALVPGHDIRAETAAHYLVLAGAFGESNLAKVNPPIRGQSDADALWAAVEDGRIDWLGSDHCCAMSEQKAGEVWDAVPGFGGAALMYPTLVSKGYLERGIPLGRIVALASANPAKAYGCYGPKGRIGIGADADIVIFDPDADRTLASEQLHSAQDHSPYAGMDLRAWPVRTLLRGRTIALDGRPVGEPTGRYLHRPLGAAVAAAPGTEAHGA